MDGMDGPIAAGSLLAQASGAAITGAARGGGLPASSAQFISIADLFTKMPEFEASTAARLQPFVDIPKLQGGKGAIASDFLQNFEMSQEFMLALQDRVSTASTFWNATSAVVGKFVTGFQQVLNTAV